MKRSENVKLPRPVLQKPSASAFAFPNTPSEPSYHAIKCPNHMGRPNGEKPRHSSQQLNRAHSSGIPNLWAAGPFGERTRDCSPGHAGKEGPQLARTAKSPASRALGQAKRAPRAAFPSGCLAPAMTGAQPPAFPRNSRGKSTVGQRKLWLE